MSTQKTFTPDLSTRLIFSAVFSIPFFISVIKTLQAATPPSSLGFAIAFLLIPQIWFSGQKIILTNNSLVYSRWFFLKKEIFFDRISKASIAIGVSRKGNGFYRLEIYDSEKFSHFPFSVNIKIFSKDALCEISRALVHYAPQASIDRPIYNLTEHDLSGLVNQGTKRLWIIFIVIITLMFLITLYRSFSR